jgi:GH24 family phage-related lysozyme (muramidase)
LVMVVKRIIILTLLLGLLAFGCLGSETSVDGNSGISASPMMKAMTESADYGGTGGAAQTQYVTKEGSITIKVGTGELQAKFDAMKAQLKSDGAELSDIRYTEYGNRKQYTIAVRVAPGRFDSMMETLRNVGEVKDMSVNLEDVTRQYVDLDTRIRNREVELSRLYELYNKSSEVKDLLDVEREITRVETDLEILKGDKQYLVSKVERSTINVTVYEDKPATTQLTLSLEGLGALFFTAMSAAITLVVVVVGFLLPVAIVVGLLWVAYKALTGKKKAGPRQPEHTRIPPPE